MRFLAVFILTALVVSINAFFIKTPHSLGIRRHTKWTMTSISSIGDIPLSSNRVGTVAKIPATPSTVKIIESTHNLTYVKDISSIDAAVLSGSELVNAWVLDNGIIKVKVVLKGGNLVSIQDINKKEYIWENTAGATYYGAGSNSFPLQRGLILHGGIRVAAVTAEHGLYYDSEWDIDFEATSTSSSIKLTITDTQENRNFLNDSLSTAQFSAGDDIPMSKYPVTDATFTFTITLKDGEDFVHLDACMETVKPTTTGEIWLPQTYPITRDSQIIAKQVLRRNKDAWVFTEMIEKGHLEYTEMVPDTDNYPEYTNKGGQLLDFPVKTTDSSLTDMYKPLDWPTAAGGILYDYPRREGIYHAVSFGTGSGIAQVSTADKHYTKMWSWGNPELFHRDPVNAPLAAGRPKEEYYEPWASGFNTAFFETHDFPLGKHSWKSLIVPIPSGLDTTLTQEDLRAVVEKRLLDINAESIIE